ncbi:MAG TPA: hypothetical protein VHZ03_32000 [Trebonia sp.]|nr:hypothetical protein [Trebonia sp.]
MRNAIGPDREVQAPAIISALPSRDLRLSPFPGTPTTRSLLRGPTIKFCDTPQDSTRTAPTALTGLFPSDINARSLKWKANIAD